MWKDLNNYEGLYKVSEYGLIFSAHSNRILSGSKCGKYLKITLCKKGKQEYIYQHRLVANTFIPNPENKPTVNHKNGIGTDNRVDNLEWVSYSENHQHAYDVLKRKPSVERPIIQLDREGNFIREHDSIKKASIFLGGKRANISNCLKGRRPTAYNFKWKYK